MKKLKSLKSFKNENLNIDDFQLKSIVGGGDKFSNTTCSEWTNHENCLDYHVTSYDDNGKLLTDKTVVTDQDYQDPCC